MTKPIIPEKASSNFDLYICNSLEKLCAMDAQLGNVREDFVIEECSELIKEISKKKRGKSNDDELFEEACDVLLTVMSMLYVQGYTGLQIMQEIDEKSCAAVNDIINKSR